MSRARFFRVIRAAINNGCLCARLEVFGLFGGVFFCKEICKFRAETRALDFEDLSADYDCEQIDFVFAALSLEVFGSSLDWNMIFSSVVS